MRKKKIERDDWVAKPVKTTAYGTLFVRGDSWFYVVAKTAWTLTLYYDKDTIDYLHDITPGQVIFMRRKKIPKRIIPGKVDAEWVRKEREKTRQYNKRKKKSS